MFLYRKEDGRRDKFADGQIENNGASTPVTYPPWFIHQRHECVRDLFAKTMSDAHRDVAKEKALMPVTGPGAESVHSALVSAVSKAKLSDLTESLALKSIQKALSTE